MSEIDKQSEAVKTAYEAGLSNGREQGVQIGIEMGLKRAAEVASRDLHNFKFPEGQIPIDMPLPQHAPKEQEAEQRNVRRRRANRLVAKNRKRRYASRPNGTWTAPVDSSKIDDDHGYDELLAEEGIYVKE